VAHAPGVGYSATPRGASGFKTPAPVVPAVPVPGPPAAAAPALPDPSGWSFPTPDVSGWSVPGGSQATKVLVVFMVLILGLGFFSRATGKPLALNLGGFAAGTPQTPLQAAAKGTQPRRAV
jgi:hypothetical protein